jgi:phosphotriesterase-related protein
MAEVPTARGDTIETSELGFTLMSEEVFLVSTDIDANWPDISFGDEDKRIEDAIRMLTVAKEHGVDTIVDRVIPGIGRNVARVKRVADAVPVNIVVSTGYYTWRDLPLFFAFRERWASPSDGPPPMLEDLFVRDLEEGIAGTGVRAGIIKCATDRHGITDDVDHVLRATARAHRRTGAPITTHTDGAATGLEQQRIFEEEGVDLGRVVIGHVDFTPGSGIGDIERIILNGSYAAFDTLALSDLRGNRESRLERVVELCARGHARGIVLSHDQACFRDLLPESITNAGPFPPFTELSLDFLPALRERGVTEHDIEQMVVRNPARIFGSRGFGGY